MRKKQEANYLSLWQTNMLGAVTLGPKAAGAAPGNMAGIILAGFLLLLIPVTATVGAGVKTLTDMGTRSKLYEDEIEAMKTAIGELGEEAFDRVVEEILEYVGHSGSSFFLWKNLHSAKVVVEQGVKAAGAEESARIQQLKLVAAVAKLGDSAKDIQVEAKPIELTGPEKASVDGAEARARSELVEKRRTGQKAALVAYLSDPRNAGKRMQHVIKAAVDVELALISMSCGGGGGGFESDRGFSK